MINLKAQMAVVRMMKYLCSNINLVHRMTSFLSLFQSALMMLSQLWESVHVQPCIMTAGHMMNMSHALVSFHLNEKMILTLSNGSELWLCLTSIGSSHIKSL